MVDMRPQSRNVDALIARLASRSKGVVTAEELFSAGVTRAEIKTRLRRGSLLREYPGVYRVGHRAPNLESSYMAAVKACGVGALLSGLSAAYLLGLIKGKPPKPEVTAPKDRRFAAHISREACKDHIVWRGIPVTSVARTLVDIAPRLSREDLARACHEAGVLHKTTPAQVERLLRPNTPGAAKLRAVLRGDERVLLSKLERKFIERLEDASLPLPETNRPAGGRRVDCRWPDHNLTVELDSYTYHHSRHAWEQDRRREREAHARGDDFRRYTWGDVFERPAPMMGELRALLPLR
jgi:predicted transcriptional regulator of viral defense system